MENELRHHGVLGQKWGVRRYQPYPAGKHGTFLGQTRDEDIRIAKGTKAYRIKSRFDPTVENETRMTFDKVDHLQYLGCEVGERGSLDLGCTYENNGRPYSVTMRLTEDILAPSYQKTMDAFVKTFEQVKVKDFTKEAFTKPERGSAKEFIRNLNNLDIDECRDKAYIKFTEKFMQDSKAKKIFFDELKAQGYNALVDERTKRFEEDGDDHPNTPMIIFDKQSVKQTRSTPLTQEDADYFSNLYWNYGEVSVRDKKVDEKWKKWAKSK